MNKMVKPINIFVLAGQKAVYGEFMLKLSWLGRNLFALNQKALQI